MRLSDFRLMLRMGKPRVVVSNNHRVGWACSAPVARRLAEDDRIEVYYAARFSNDVPRHEDLRTVEAFYRSQGISRGIIPFRRAKHAAFDAAILTHANRSLLPKRARRKALCFHGVSFKNFLLHPRNVSRVDQMWVPGPYHRRRFVETGLCREDDPRLRPVGMPKTDALLDPSPSQAEIRQSFGLDPSVPTVLIAPTGMPGNAFDVCGPDLAARLVERGLQVLLKPHDHPRGGAATEEEYRSQYNRLAGPMIKVIWDPDCVPSFKASDVLVTGASSVSFEYALLGRPIVFVDVPVILERLRATGRPLDLETWGRKIGTLVTDGKEADEQIARIIQEGGDGLGEIRKACCADMLYNHGAATEAAVRGVYELLSMSLPSSRPSTSGSSNWAS